MGLSMLKFHQSLDLMNEDEMSVYKEKNSLHSTSFLVWFVTLYITLYSRIIIINYKFIAKINIKNKIKQ